MMEDKRKYMLSVDQSTQGTKALLFDRGRAASYGAGDMAHRQIINEKRLGWSMIWRKSGRIPSWR